jgi:hypothetical protein
MAFNAARKANPHAAPREPVAARDWSTQAGAYEQAELIRRYWMGKGRYVTVAVEQRSKHAREGLFGIRSNLVNGLPPA